MLRHPFLDPKFVHLEDLPVALEVLVEDFDSGIHQAQFEVEWVFADVFNFWLFIAFRGGALLSFIFVRLGMLKFLRILRALRLVHLLR